MGLLLDWIKANPGIVASLVSAVVAASVALVVFAITQWLISKRNRTQFLAPKLETLYLVVNRIAAEHTAVCTEAFRAVDGDDAAASRIREMDHLELYGHRTAKEAIMYIRLYFPKLALIHQRIFAAQRELNNRLFEVSIGKPPSMEDMLEAAGAVSHFVMLMEREIVRNRDALIGDRLWPRRYKSTSQAELEEIAPPPNVPMWTKQAEQPAG